MSKEFLKYYLQYAKLKLGEKEKRLLRYYQSYTSNIRAKVLMMKKEKNKADMRKIRNYLRLMIDYSP